MLRRVQVPKEYTYIGVYLTLRCNLHCSYCINSHGKLSRKCQELFADDWIRGLNRLDISTDLPITLEGGEPTLHCGFYKIANLLSYKIDLLTNLQFDSQTFIDNMSPMLFSQQKSGAYKSIRVSYHIDSMDDNEILEKILELQNAGFRVGLFGINVPSAISQNMYMTEKARLARVYFYVKDFLGKWDGQMYGTYKYPDAINNDSQKVQCKTQELLIAPDGFIYKCHHDLYLMDQKLSIGHILDETLKIRSEFRDCDKFGQCNPCDIKLKTDRFLKMGHCVMEIISV